MSEAGASRDNRTPVPARPSKKGRSSPRPQARPANRRPGPKAGPAAWQARRRRRHLWIAIVSVVVVLAAVGTLVGVKVAGGGSKTAAGDRAPAPADLVAHVTSVPMSTLVAAAQKVTIQYQPQPITGAALTSNGKPEVLFIGAEFCPVCATERWPMVVALSKFGTFTNLSKIHSAVTDGNIATFSFYGSSYSSPYITFTPVENETRSQQPLQKPTAAQQALWAKYTLSGGSLHYPFLDIAGKYVVTTAQYPEQAVGGGQSFAQIANSVGNNNNTVGANVDAAAVTLIKSICDATGQKPAATCSPVAKVSAGGSSSSTGSGPSSSAG